MTKKILLILLLCTGCRADTPDKLLDAIEQVESGGKADAVGDNGKAIGSFQLWRIFVDDVNRIYKTKYSYEDRLDQKKSREMARFYLKHYAKNKTIEQQSRIFNGGPKGDKKECTKMYWLKVQKQLEKE